MDDTLQHRIGYTGLYPGFYGLERDIAIIHAGQRRLNRRRVDGYFFGDKEPSVWGKPGQGRLGKFHPSIAVSGAKITHTKDFNMPK
jgi:hypothetical protein